MDAEAGIGDGCSEGVGGGLGGAVESEEDGVDAVVGGEREEFAELVAEPGGVGERGEDGGGAEGRGAGGRRRGRAGKEPCEQANGERVEDVGVEQKDNGQQEEGAEERSEHGGRRIAGSRGGREVRRKKYEVLVEESGAPKIGGRRAERVQSKHLAQGGRNSGLPEPRNPGKN